MNKDELWNEWDKTQIKDLINLLDEYENSGNEILKEILIEYLYERRRINIKKI